MNMPAQVANSSAVKIREVQLSEYPHIEALLRRNGLYTKKREEWEHLWVNNPVYKKLQQWAVGWAVEDSQQEIVGYIGNLPVSASFRGREFIASCMNSLVADPSYRGYAGYLLRRAINYKLPDLTIASTANGDAVHLLDGFRLSHIPAGDWGQASFWITHYSGFAGSVFAQKGWSRPLSTSAATILWLKDHLSRRNSWIQKHLEKFEVSPAFDERFDVFWHELKHVYPERLLLTRSREVLDWHFRFAVQDQRLWIVTCSDNSRMMAYALFRRRDVPEYGLKRMQFIDFQTLNGDNDVLVAMVAWALKKCQEEGIHTLEAFGFHPRKQSVIDGLKPYHRKLPSWWYFYKAVNKDLGRELQNPDLWDPSHFDGDASL